MEYVDVAFRRNVEIVALSLKNFVTRAFNHDDDRNIHVKQLCISVLIVH